MIYKSCRLWPSSALAVTKELYNNELEGRVDNAVQQVTALKPNADEEDGFVALWKQRADPSGAVRSLTPR